jgi:hypothetical protein
LYYFPTKQVNGDIITPFELVHHQKPDLRVLFKMFSLAAVHRERQGDCRIQKFESQSIPMIAVGRCQNSNGLQFYNPANGTFVSSIDYKLQPIVTSGVKFGYAYQPGTFIYHLDETTTMHTPTFSLDPKVYVHTHSPPHLATVIGIPTYECPDVYTVSFSDGSIAEYSESSRLLEAAPTISPIVPVLLPHWLKYDVNVTLFLSDMSKPRHGKLFRDSNHQWIFCPGKTIDWTKGITLPDISASIQSLLDTGQLFKGHKKFNKVYQAHSQIQLEDSVLRHVSAHGLQSLLAPTSLHKHATFSPRDKVIWDSAYDEEYDGLNNLPTWDIVSESDFKRLHQIAKALPSMALACIKYDEFNKPKRAKYRIRAHPPPTGSI